MKKSFRGIAPLIISVILIFFAAALVAEKGENGELAYSELVTNIQENNVDSITLSSEGNSATVKLKNVREEKRVNIPDKNAFMLSIQDDISSKNIKFKEKSPSALLKLLDYITPISLVILFILFWVFMLQTMNGGKGAMSFTKNRARLSNPDDKKKVTFKDVAGLAEERGELQEIVEFLKYPKKFTDMGARIPKGVLLVGQPGTGKTLLAKAVAGEAGVPFYTISGSDFVEMFVGVGASRVRDLFEQAKKNAPAIIFIDEIDAVGRKRGAGLGGGHDEREQTLNQLLVEMDGFGVNQGIIIMAATNRPDILDPALLRPGRFDREIVVGAPDVKGREAIFKVHSRNKPLAKDVKVDVLAKRTPGFTPADIENIMNESAILTARKREKQIHMDTIEEAITKVMVGVAKKSRVISEKDRKLTAYHEAGHAICMHVLEHVNPVHQVTIIPRGRAGGFTEPLPQEDQMYGTKNEMKETIIMALGGRVAEELIMEDISTGASNDLERVTSIARAMVTKYGMSEKLGPMVYGDSDEEVFLGNSISTKKNYSEEIAYEIDKEVRDIVETAYEKCRKILTDYSAQLDYVAKGLLAYETLDSEQFIKAFNQELPLDKGVLNENTDESSLTEEEVKVDITKKVENPYVDKSESTDEKTTTVDLSKDGSISEDEK